MSARFALDPRLVVGTHEIGELPLSRIVLMDDARFPWLILIPRIAGARELVDLDEGDQRALLAEINLVGRTLETMFKPDKLNIAALGNVVPQLHVHVIARFSGDAAWPQPVWGRGEPLVYADTERASRIAGIRAALREVLT